MKFMMKRILAAILCLLMLLPLAACGRSEKTEEEKTPEYVYRAEYKKLGSFKNGYLNARFFTEDGYYAVSYEKVGETVVYSDNAETGEPMPAPQPAEFAALGTEDVTEEIPDGENTVVEDVYACLLYFVGFDGTIEKLSGYKYLEPKQNTDNMKEFYSGVDMSGFHRCDDGTFITVESAYASWNEAPDDLGYGDDSYWNYSKYEQNYYIRHLAADGTELSCAPIDINMNDNYLNCYGATVDEQGNMLCSIGETVYAINADGLAEYTIDTGCSVDSFVKLSGDIYMLAWGEEGEKLFKLDTASRTVGEAIDLPNGAYTIFPGNGEHDFYYNNGTNFFAYDIETGNAEKLFNWINCDVNVDTLETIAVQEDGSILGISSEYDGQDESYSFNLVNVTKVPYDPSTQKPVITLACMYVDYDLRDRVIKFNRSNENCRIEIVDYSEYNTEEYQNGMDYNSGLNKLTTEIMAGKVPDIIDLNGLPYNQLAAKGLLEDIYPFIDADSELSRDDFLPNILKAAEFDGKLCCVVPGFYVETVVGASSIVGDEPGWNYDELNAALDNMPEGCSLFDDYITRDDVLRTCLALDINEYLDWETGKCSFDTESFIKLLKFVNSFPAEYNWEEYEENYESTESRIKDGRQMLVQTGIWSIDDVLYTSNMDANYFNGDYTFIGFPTESGSGSMIGYSSRYAMSSKCERKDEAWQFLREFLTENYQDSMWNIPVNINVFNRQLKKLMTVEYLTDEYGNTIRDEDGNEVMIEKGSIYTDSGEPIPYYALTQEQADKFIYLVESLDKVSDYSSDGIFDIVRDEAAAFFAGSKSAADVAKLIQNKANLYVNEQR